MTHSVAQSPTLTCPACRRPYPAEVWLIVDTTERPDLLARMQAGTLHDIPCPHCRHDNNLDAPLLIYRPGQTPPILFSPAERTTAEQDQEHAIGLINLLRDRLGSAWQDAWLSQGLTGVPRQILPAALSDDPQAALRELLARAQAEIERLQREDPDAYARLEEASREAAHGSTEFTEVQAEEDDDSREDGEEPDDEPDGVGAGERVEDAQAPLLRTLELFVQAQSWDESQRIVEQHPELLSDDADAALGDWIAEWQARQNAEAADLLTEHRNLLRRCREAGVPRAFAEKMLPPEGIAEAERLGLAPEEFLAQMRAAAPGKGVDVPSEFENDWDQANEEEERYLRTNNQTALDAAVAAWEHILRHPAFPATDARFQLATMNDAGSVFLRRYWSRGRLTDLNRALDLWQTAVQRTPPDSPDLPRNLNNLGTGLRARYARTGQLADLAEAIRVYEQAVQGTPPDSPDLPGYLNNLGNGLRDRYARTGALADLEEAIRVYQTAVQRTPPDSPDLPMYLNNLGTGLSDRYARTGQWADLAEAQNSYRRACTLGLTVASAEALRSARNWGKWALARKEWEEAATAYDFGRRALDQLFQGQIDRAAKESWLKEAQGLPANAAYALAQLDRLPEAITALEQGRARLLAAALEAARRDLARLPALGHAAEHRRYVQAAEHLRALQGSAAQPVVHSSDRPDAPPDFASRRQQMEAANAELNAAIAAIRQVPGYEDFFLPPTFARIQRAATPAAPLVYLATTAVGSVAIVVRGAETSEVLETSEVCLPVGLVWLDALTEAHVREAVVGPAGGQPLGGYLGAYDGWRRDPRDETALAAWHAALDATTHWLWEKLMGTVVRELQAQGFEQAVLVPTGLLGLLPLHAAWTEDAAAPTGRRYALDALALRYAPNAGALAASQETAARVPATGVLAVDNPDGTLVFSGQEVDAVLSYFPAGAGHPLRGRAATRSAVLDQLAEFPVYHFSTHGWAGWTEPLQGGLRLAGGANLTLADILDLRLTGARLAVLSACETGIPGTELPDEVVSLPAGLLQAGAAGVVASLWAVNDLSTAMLIERFYRLWRREGLPPAEALRSAQRWLRDATNRDLVDYFKRDLPSGARMPEMVAAEFLEDRFFEPDPNARPFAHPYWWAAFTMTGV